MPPISNLPVAPRPGCRPISGAARGILARRDPAIRKSLVGSKSCGHKKCAENTSKAPAYNKKSAALVCRPCFFLFRRYARIPLSLPLLHRGAAPIESYASVLSKCECARTWILLLPLRFNLCRHISILIGCPQRSKKSGILRTARLRFLEPKPTEDHRRFAAYRRERSL